jgi:flagellar protein FlaJ
MDVPAETAPEEEPSSEAPAGLPSAVDIAPPAEQDSGRERLMQALVPTLSFLVLAIMAFVPLAFAGVVPLSQDPAQQDARLVQVLIFSSVVLYGTLAAFLGGGYGKVKQRASGARMMYKTKRDLVLNAVAVATTVLTIILVVVELFALLAFMELIEATSQASIAFASNYVLFAAATLLFLALMILARTTYTTRRELSQRDRAIAYSLMPVSALIIIVSLLVSLGILQAGVFAGVEPGQSVYILTLAVLFQLISFKLLLRYPPIVAIALSAVTSARKASKDMRDEIQKRAFRTYMVGLAFLVLSIFFVGGIATQRITIQEQRTTNFLLLFYIIAGAVILGIMVTRYLQHRFVDARERREETGELIAKKRLTPDQVRRLVIFSFSGLFGTTFLLLGLLTLMGRTPIEETYGTDFLIMAFLTGVGPFGFYHAYRLRRQRAMDEKFPDFLRDLAESERSGMTLPKALLTAARGTYGALTPEIRVMSAQVEWGVSFTEALMRFSRRVGTPLVERAAVLIVEAASAGGNVVDVLTAAADDAREIKQILEDRTRQMAIYSMIIYIAFFVFLVVIFVLAAQFLPAFEEALGGASGEQVGGLSLAAFDKEDFITIFFHGSLIQAVGGGLIAGVMTGGSPIDGLKHSFIMTIIAWIFFRVLL